MKYLVMAQKALNLFKTLKVIFDNWGVLTSVIGFAITAAVWITNDNLYKESQKQINKETEAKLTLIFLNQTNTSSKIDSFNVKLDRGLNKINGIDKFLQTKYSNDINYWKYKAAQTAMKNDCEKKKSQDTIPLFHQSENYQLPEFSFLTVNIR